MQTVETLNEGLKRAYTVTITSKDIDARVEKEVKAIAPQVRMPGFRPGKVPANLIRKSRRPFTLNLCRVRAKDAGEVAHLVQQVKTEQACKEILQAKVRRSD